MNDRGQCKDCHHWQRTRMHISGTVFDAGKFSTGGWGWCNAIFIDGTYDPAIPEHEVARIEDEQRDAARFGIFGTDAISVDFCTAPDFGCIMFIALAPLPAREEGVKTDG